MYVVQPPHKFELKSFWMVHYGRLRAFANITCSGRALETYSDQGDIKEVCYLATYVKQTCGSTMAML